MQRKKTTTGGKKYKFFGDTLFREIVSWSNYKKCNKPES